MVLKMIRRGRLVLVIGGQESQNYSERVIRLESTKIRWLSHDGQVGGWTGYPAAAQGLYFLKIKPRGA